MTRRHDTATGDLFSVPKAAAPIEGSMDFRRQISALVGNMLTAAARAGIDRYEVSAQASRLAGRDVSKLMLDGYTAESREEFNLPFWLVPVLETVCSSTLLTDWLASVRGGRVLMGHETIDAEIGRLAHERDQASEEIRRLKAMRKGAR